MAKSYEQISNQNAHSQGKTDANLANDSNHLGGIPAAEYATQKYVQDYHNNKESTLKQYIDNQDNQKLNEAKEYADSLVRNQDFSNFAKTTDLNALDQKLLNKISECSINCTNNLKTEIKKVVDDTNANFNDVSTAITTLNKNQQDLFQSVSDGKKDIAEAITDKGVTTSATASYSTMANNIRKIETNNIPEGYVYTGDATAKASDISIGESAYVDGQKIYGTNTEVNISQITPTYGTDTTGTTATASDILQGKTAYSNGQLLTGTLDINIQEIYGLSDENYTVTNVSGYSNIKPSMDSDIIYKSTGIFGVSKCGNFIVNECIVTDTSNNTEKRYIQSRKMNDTEVYTSATASSEGGTTNRKSLWTFEELGLDNTKGIDYITFGNAGLNNVSTDAALCIVQKNKIHFYRYSVSNLSYGYIGYDYNSNYNWHWTIELTNSQNEVYGISGPIVAANLNPNIFAVAIDNFSFATIKIESAYQNQVSFHVGSFIKYTASRGITSCAFSSNDNYIYGTLHNNHNNGTYIAGYSLICKVSKNAKDYYPKGIIAVADTCVILPNEVQAMCQGYMYTLSSTDGNTPVLSEQSETQFVTRRPSYAGFSPDLRYYYEAYWKPNAITFANYLKIYNVNFNATEEWQEIQTISLPTMSGVGKNAKLEIASDMSFGTAANEDSIVRFRKSLDTNKLVGVHYKNKKFYSESVMEVEQ